ncbi:hypothetical protein C1637_03725 [Chryseobacterium lactis]|uniref:DUF4595 domain-containing protein n=1 Tax=Chryseobacterium lactis TaxID=1241981 RepID=A0A3G6RXR6_CHRLC|nr:hypothetical protein [Chryseobacterium lactis]AZA81696.1 hypothetical protein EG342_07120 [Chryseobacterium lactis]AZB06694.1 hypothetical protein EG341_23240 [Chryseobacterium lactis]PNW15545.1 hypothetical protein C1637_03725 [Chryseobacterium lactis]
MVKNYFLKMFAGIAFLGLLASCNTTADPIESVPNPDGGPPPQKVLTKVSVNNVSQEEYFTTADVLDQAVFKDNSLNAGNANYTATLTYINTTTNPKIKKEISKVKFVSSASSSLKYDFDITPDGNGKIYNATLIATGATPGVSYLSDYTFTYEATTGKLSKILEKRKEGGISAYNKFIEYAFTYTGENIIQAVCSKGILDINGNPNMTTATKSKYSFQNYDSQKSPFSTLPKTYFLMLSLIDPINFYKACPNNPTSMFIEIPTKPSVNTAQSYSYDNQGYPAVEKNQNVSFTYKTL